MRRLLVVGGDGFVGRAVTRAAAAAGVEAVPADRTSRAGAARDLVTMDATDASSVRRALEATRPDAVVLLAAYGAGTEGLARGASADPARAVDVNVRSAALLAAECAGVGCGVFVLGSSTTVYGPARAYRQRRVPERVPLLPAAPYGATKAAAEAMTFALAERYGLRAVAVRLPLVYGAGRWYGGSQRELVDFVAAVARGGPATIRAWTGRADWLHVDDAAASLVAAATVEAAQGAYNVTGHTGSLAELAGAVAAHARADARVEPVAARGPDLPLVDDGRIRRQVGFAPVHATATSGAAAYVADTRRSP